MFSSRAFFWGRAYCKRASMSSVAASGFFLWSSQHNNPCSPHLSCSVKSSAKPQELVSNWSDPKKAAKLEVNYQTPEVIRQRRELMLLLQPRSGERVLDIGCGPGFTANDIAAAVGSEGFVDAIDVSSAMIKLASSRLSNVKNTALHLGDAQALPFGDEVFDAVVISQVILYLHDVPQALAEVRRVLRPGGRLVICETDWNSLVVHTRDEERFQRIFKACCSTFLDAHVPPKVPGLLQRAGLHVSSACTVPMLAAGSTDTSTWIGNWAFNVIKEKGAAFGLSELDINGWLEEQHSLNDQGAFFACVHRFLFLAYKPEALKP